MWYQVGFRGDCIRQGANSATDCRERVCAPLSIRAREAADPVDRAQLAGGLVVVVEVVRSNHQPMGLARIESRADRGPRSTGGSRRAEHRGGRGRVPRGPARSRRRRPVTAGCPASGTAAGCRGRETPPPRREVPREPVASGPRWRARRTRAQSHPRPMRHVRTRGAATLRAPLLHVPRASPASSRGAAGSGCATRGACPRRTSRD